MTDYISREAAIAYIREQSEECQKAFEELGGESGIYADAYSALEPSAMRSYRSRHTRSSARSRKN